MRTSFDPEMPYNRSFWLGGLHLARHPELEELATDVARLGQVFDDLWSGPVDRAVAEELLLDWGPGILGRLHLVALAWFIDEKSLRAVKDAVRGALPADVLATHPALQARWHRRAAAALLLRHSPDALVEVYAWDQYHPKARAALKMANQARKLGTPLADEHWADHAEAALDTLPQGRRPRGLRFERAIPRPWCDDVLLVFREHGRPDTHRDTADHVAPGWRDEWMFLRFHDHGARVDVTSRDPERAKSLASAVGSRLFGANVSYRHARDPLTRDRLNEFLDRLLDADDAVFFLHEMSAGMDAYDDRPHAVVGRWGSGRVEEVACAMRDAHGFARDSTLVDYAKIAFLDDDGAHHRMTVYFPEPADHGHDLALSFHDSGVATDVGLRFAARLQGALGVEVHPRVPDPARSRRASRTSGKPARTGVAEWLAVLAPRLDSPAPWQRAMLEEVEDLGLVHVTRETVFRCGDTRIPANVRALGSTGCPGDVTMPFGSVSREDGFTQDPGETFRCDAGGHEWRLGTYGPTCTLRVRTRVNAPAAASWFRKLVRGSRWEEDERGVFSKFVAGKGRRTLVLLDEADAAFRAPDSPRMAWVSLDNRADVRVFGDRTLGLACLVCDGAAAIPAAFGDGPELAVLLASERPGTPYRAGTLIEPSEAGICSGGRTIIPRTQPRFRLLFALLQAWHDRHDGASVPPARASDLAALDESLTLVASDIHTLIHDFRKDVGPEADAIIERNGRKGLRLGDGYRVAGFDLNDELLDFKDRVRKDR